MTIDEKNKQKINKNKKGTENAVLPKARDCQLLFLTKNQIKTIN